MKKLNLTILTLALLSGAALGQSKRHHYLISACFSLPNFGTCNATFSLAREPNNKDCKNMMHIMTGKDTSGMVILAISPITKWQHIHWLENKSYIKKIINADKPVKK